VRTCAALGGARCRLGGGLRRREVALHQAPEIGEVGEVALAAKELPAELVLQLADRTGQRRQRDVDLLGGAGEVQRLAGGEEIADLVHLQQRLPRSRGQGRNLHARSGHRVDACIASSRSRTVSFSAARSCARRLPCHVVLDQSCGG